MSLLWAKRGWLTPGSQTIRALDRFGATDVWDFVDNSYMRAGVVTTNAGLTVTRASSGYAETSDGRLVSFGSGVLRHTDKGLLVEGARTNLLTYSQAFNELSPGAWTVDNGGSTNPVVTANYGAAPDGTTTADRIQFDKTGGTYSRIFQDLSGVSSAVYIFSVYMRTLTGTANVGIRIEGTGVNCAVTTTWQRFSVSLPSAGTSATSQILLFDSIPGNDETADVLVWGAQTEAGAFASSYTPTEGSAVTRAADQVTVTLSALTSGYSMYAQWSGSQNGGSRVIDFGGSTLIRRSGGTNLNFNGAGLEGSAVGAFASGKAAIAIDAAAVRGAANGSSVTVTNGSYSSSSQTALRFGSTGTSNYLDGYIRRIAIFPSALSDAQLQAITT